MYFTIAELDLLILRRQLANAQWHLASVRRYDGNTDAAEAEVKRLLTRVWIAQDEVECLITLRAGDKARILEALA